MEGETIDQQQPRSLVSRLKAFVYSATHAVEKVPTEQITAATIADLITKEDWQEPFSIVDVLKAFGYIAPWYKIDYQEKILQQYGETRTALHQLTARGVLQIVSLEEPDINKETVHYEVVDIDELKNIAASASKNNS